MATPVRSADGLKRRREQGRLRARERRAAETPEQREARLSQRRGWYQRNRASQRVHMAALRGSDLDEYEVEILLGDPCAYCGGLATGVDHVVPMTCGGTGGWANLTAACVDCNRHKKDSTLLHFLLRERLARDVPDAVRLAVAGAADAGHSIAAIRRCVAAELEVVRARR